MDYERRFQDAINRLKAEERYRIFANLERDASRFPMAHVAPGGRRDSPREVTVWCSNDYLGMGQHPKVIGAMVSAARAHGTGAGGTRNIAGTNHPLVELEAELADLHGKPASLVFTSGYVSNSPASRRSPSLMPNCLILSDAWNHNSMIEGVRQAGCEKQIFRHNDIAHLEALLAAADPARPKLVVFESLYSMDGDVAPIAAICDLAERYGAMTYIDEVHAVGMYGPRGGGISERDGARAPHRRDRGHARQGLRLARRLYRGSAAVIDAVRCYAPGFIFTTALPPSVAAAPTAAIRHLKTSNGERERHQDWRRSSRTRLRAAGLPVMDKPAHIVPVFVGDAEQVQRGERPAARAARHLYPADQLSDRAKGTERLRITPTPAHSEAQVADLVESLVDVWTTLGLRFEPAKVIPLRPAAQDPAQCVYPEMRKAAE